MTTEEHTFTWNITKNQYKSTVHEATCSCGEVIEGTRPNQNGAVSKYSKHAALAHISKLSLDGVGAPMQLVGKVIKKRVTNEIWIVSFNGDFPAEVADSFSWKLKQTDWYQINPWTILIKNSHGWKDRWSHFQYREQAYGAAQSWLEDQRVDGHDIEMASQIDMDTIEIPFGAVEQYLTELVDRANAADKPKDLVALQSQIKEARSMVTMLEHAQQLVEAKLVGIELPDDPQYESYEYVPNA